MVTFFFASLWKRNVVDWYTAAMMLSWVNNVCRAHLDAMYALLLGTLSLCIHALPFLQSPHPFGYDTGFYRRYLIEPFVSFPNTPVPGLGDDALIPRLLFDLLRAMHISTDLTLYASYLTLFATLPVLVFFLVKPRLSTRGAFLAALFVALSPIQYNALWYFFFKNAFGLCILIGTFVCIERRWWAALFAFDVAIALSHKTTAILYLATLAVLFALDRARRKPILMHALLCAAVLLAVGYDSLATAVRVPPAALFLDSHTFLSLALPFIIMIVPYLLFLRAYRAPSVIIAFTIASFAFPIFQLPFFERVFIFCDIALAILAGFAMEGALSQFDRNDLSMKRVVPIGAAIIGASLLLGSLVHQVRTLAPIMSSSDIQIIENIGAIVPSEATILTTSDEAPWFEGWTEAHIAAPGMLKDNHNLEEWMTFWTATSTAAQIDFLADFSHPLYIATLGPREALLGSSTIPCLREISEHLLFDACEHPL